MSEVNERIDDVNHKMVGLIRQNENLMKLLVDRLPPLSAQLQPVPGVAPFKGSKAPLLNEPGEDETQRGEGFN